MTAPRNYCAVFWGSHGCDLPPGHTNPPEHICTTWDDDAERVAPCCTISPDGFVRYWDRVTGTWDAPSPHLYIFGEDWRPVG